VVVGVCEIRFKVVGARSLKDKRKVLKSLKDRFSRLNLSVAEVDDNDKWQACTLGLACVSNDTGFINSIFDRIIHGFEDEGETEILGTRTEIMHI
jgi:uncharacterized protein